MVLPAWLGRQPRKHIKRRAALNVESLDPRVLLSAGAVWSQAPSAGDVASESAVRVAKRMSDVAFSRSGAKLDVYMPVGDAPPAGVRPAIVAFPGGGWRWADREDYGEALAGFCRHGFVVVAADYAYAFPGGRSTWPANLRDVQSAIRWVRSNADRLKVDPNKIVAMGESAGAHLAALAGVVREGVDAARVRSGRARGAGVSARVQAVVAFYGPMDLAAEWRQHRGARPYLQSFLGGSPSRFPERYAAASPLTHVSSDDPPVYLTQGTADRVIDVGQTTRFAEALRAAGVRVEVNILEGVPHGFRFKFSSENMRGLLAFLNRVLGLRRE